MGRLTSTARRGIQRDVAEARIDVLSQQIAELHRELTFYAERYVALLATIERKGYTVLEYHGALHLAWAGAGSSDPVTKEGEGGAPLHAGRPAAAERARGTGAG